MATAKKSSPKTTKPAVKRAPAKARATTKVTKKSSAAQSKSLRSFRPHRTSREAFFTFRVTRQTLYWLILTGIVLLLGIWVMSISIKVQQIYDQIDASNESMYITTPERVR